MEEEAMGGEEQAAFLFGIHLVSNYNRSLIGFHAFRSI